MLFILMICKIICVCLIWCKNCVFKLIFWEVFLIKFGKFVIVKFWLLLVVIIFKFGINVVKW